MGKEPKQFLTDILYNYPNLPNGLLVKELECLSEYLLKNGAFVNPCKIGDDFYAVLEDANTVVRYKCGSIKHNDFGNGFTITLLATMGGSEYIYGTGAFLTEEEAKNAIETNRAKNRGLEF